MDTPTYGKISPQVGANVRTKRAMVTTADGTVRRAIVEDFANDPDAWTQFNNWSPGGKTAVLGRGWQSPENARCEDEHKRFRMDPGKWLYDSYLLNIKKKLTTAAVVERVSHYNGVAFLPDGTNKRDISGGGSGFTYGLNDSPDGKLVCYHEGYQVFISNSDGSSK